jgi:hypothetical protein
MAKQTFTTGQVLTAAQMTSLQQTAMGGGEATAKTASYVLTAADAGTTVIMNAAGATTITVNTALFAAGDTVNIQNIGAGVCTVTAGTATVNTAGSLALGQYEGGVLYFRSTSAATFFDYVQTGAVSPLTTKGDVWGYSTLDARIPVGANNTVLTADSAQALGVKWATVSAGYTLISTTTITATSTTTISVSANSYSQLVIILDNIFLGTNGEEINIRFNGDTGANYKFFRVGTSGTASDVNANSSSTDINGFFGATGTASSKGNGFLQINRPNGTDKFTFGGNSFTTNNAGTISSRYVGGWYDGAAVISSISVIGSNSATVTGTVYLYGI